MGNQLHVCGLSACMLLPGMQTSRHGAAHLYVLHCRPKQCRIQSGLVPDQRRLPHDTQEWLVGAWLKPDQELCKQQSRCQVLVLPVTVQFIKCHWC